MMNLVITEKPSVAAAVSAALGLEMKTKYGYICKDYVVSWCIGHLVTLAQPAAYAEKYQKWNRSDLPIIPDKWQYEVIEQTRAQYEALKEMMLDPKIGTVICATDAGREGELIFRLVYEHCGCTKPVKRLWISSLEPETIRRGFANLCDGSEYDNLYKAALCRAKADWLVGINATRLYSLLYGPKLNIGRVVTPTLALITRREQAIANFKSSPFYHVQLSCGFNAKTRRINSLEEAEKIRAACDGKAATVKSIQRTSHADKPPYLYDLTTLQRDANRIYGFTAQQTMDYIQRLYEKRLATYPRTDSRFVTSDMAATLPRLVQHTADCLPFVAGLDLPVNVERVVDDTKVSDHHAILPTNAISREKLTKLSSGERSILELIIVRLVTAVGDNHLYDKVVVTLECEGYTFMASGKSITQMGWLIPVKTHHGSLGDLMAKENTGNKDYPIPELTEGQVLNPVTASIKEGKTIVPTHYTEDKLLASMEIAGQEDMPADAERKGIGTSATRAGTIEKLIETGLVERHGTGKTKHLLPTEVGYTLISLLPERLTSPLLTAEWEHRLMEIERGEADADTFMKDICRMLNELVDSAEVNEEAKRLLTPEREVLGKCPGCGGEVEARSSGAFCRNKCGFQLWWDNPYLTKFRVKVTPELVKELLVNRSVYRTDLWSASKNKPFAARIIMETDSRHRPCFRMQFPD